MSNFEYELGIIGAGQMGYAIADGAVKSGIIKGCQIMASDPFRLSEKQQKWEKLGISCTKNNADG